MPEGRKKRVYAFYISISQHFIKAMIALLSYGRRGKGEKVDKELFKNGSGYSDPTAYKAFMNIEKERDEKMDFKRGEIFEVEMNNSIYNKKALVVSADFRSGESYLNVILLTDEPKGNINVPIICEGKMYADCGMVSFITSNRLLRFIRKAREEEMAKIDEGVAKCLGIEIEPVYMDSNEEIERLQHELRKCNNIIPVCDNTEELAAAKAEAKIYKDLYERLLAKVMG